MQMRNVAAIARKEVYHLIRDFRSLFLAFAIPVILILLFGYALSLDVDNVEVAVVDQDRTDLSRDFLRSLDASPYFRIVAHPPDAKAAGAMLDRSDATMAVILPPG